MKYKDYYAILDIERGANEEEIRKAYRRLARRYHPDISREEGAEERFKDVNEAYQTLSDPEKRQAYDQLGSHRPGEDFRPPPDWNTRFWQEDGAEDVDLADLFERMGFRSARSRSGGGASFSLRGQDLELPVSIPLEEAARGTEVNLELISSELTGDGRVQRTPRTVRFRVPKGVVDGERLRVPGRGGEGIGGGPPGDLYLDIQLQPHPLFRAVGHDLYLDLPLAPWEAVLGAEVRVPTLQGAVSLNVRAGARGGQKLRLGGKGLPRRRQGSGDLFCVVQVVTPTEISERERELYRELASRSDFHPRAHLDHRSPVGGSSHG